ncbi:Uu.00g081370.m01.CDS01 [Anthostomella pinea]|uniref:Uu.00g081370.m01.CDS01 n=1 Tax=Anthostomella pinea TaxID=933095 RepID=A0AAI8VL56_9PEZI|nr:Uu.00g081370.m01.CDS01 [Anthostomella pinea]
MFLVPTQQPQHQALVGNYPSLPRASEPQLRSQSAGVKFGSLLNASDSPMERGVHDYSQSGLPSPYPSISGDAQSEASPADHASAATYPSNQEARPAGYSSSATPTSEYGAYPQSARSSTSSFQEHSIRHQYHPASNHSGSSGGMAQQTPTSPSMPLQDGRTHQSEQVKSDSDVPIDPSIAAPSPSAYSAHSQYSPYGAAPPQDMAHYPPSAGSMYAQPRPDWSNYGHPGGQMPHPHQVPFPHTPTSAPPGRPPQYGGQVYSFVPIPGAQQHKRPRRRYEEIERMYKCGWQGCEKAYGTLNHLNAHVTMQSHGQKRTPEEFKEIRKEWKARKKEEDQQRKAAEEADRQRHAQAAAQAQAQNGGPDGGDAGQPSSSYTTSRQVQLPPIGYQNNQYPAPPSSTVPPQSMPEYSPNGHLYANSYQPASPYAPQAQQMYSQRE